MEKGKHIEEKMIDKFSGCLRFCSSNTNNQKNLCRRDEMESFLYTLIFLVKGELPWMNVNASNISEAYFAVGVMKQKNKADLLQGLPENFKNLLNYINELKFADKPNYGYIRT